MNEVWTSIISGGFAGAGVVAVLAKFLIESRIKRSIQKYQHELDTRKDTLQTELSVYAHQKNLKFSKYDEAKRDSIKNIYVAVIATSFTRNGFQKIIGVETDITIEEFRSHYFQAFSKTFDSFDVVYKKITIAYAVLEDNSIYIEQELENEVIAVLQAVKQHYDEGHNILKSAHAKTRTLYKNGNLNRESAPFDFGEFHDLSLSNWNLTTINVRHNLKNT
ncbi:MAG: hypothetical protein ACTIM4_08245 [Marinomonas sp.]